MTVAELAKERNVDPRIVRDALWNIGLAVSGDDGEIPADALEMVRDAVPVRAPDPAPVVAKRASAPAPSTPDEAPTETEEPVVEAAPEPVEPAPERVVTKRLRQGLRKRKRVPG